MNLAHNLERSARLFPDHVAVIQDGRSITYAQLDQWASRLAGGLRGLGLEPGQLIALCAPNSASWLAFYFGVLKLGGVAVTLAVQSSDRELEMLLAHARPRALFCAQERAALVEGLRESCGLEFIIGPKEGLSLEGLEQKGEAPLQAVRRERGDTACVLYTGGTTGIPKGVELSHENINTAINQVAHMERSVESDRAICFLPFNHVFGQMHIMNATIMTGGGLVLLPKFDLDQVLAAIAEHEVTKLFAVPTVYVRLLHLEGLKQKLGKVRYCFSAAASMAREVVRRWQELTGLAIHEAYGMTETASMVTYNHFSRHVVGSVGQPVGTTEVSIRDAQGNELPQGREGEICIQGRGVMKGYLGLDEATREAFHGDWLRSGDIGLLDQDGYLFIVDRIKDLIITGGENVYPREVEEVLVEYPEVAECSVIGVPDPEYGERVVAVCVPAPGRVIQPEALRLDLKSKLSGFKVPKEIMVKDDLPKSPSGKILKREIKKALT
ncbi:MAG: AMP-binding protein [Desulfarculaceae bacterium]|nr:AMP-binding protein [Desulfarculaceae bacterium]MCF8071506.1 AMP-binding protein [Desulfarculaceae bacterium]MCF8102321.1 AMP-binding protein [Desulfarculaceae bacterium]MCF8114785.1 AMP-binding protein [Desulfarculaceae bacterium]